MFYSLRCCPRRWIGQKDKSTQSWIHFCNYVGQNSSFCEWFGTNAIFREKARLIVTSPIAWMTHLYNTFYNLYDIVLRKKNRWQQLKYSICNINYKIRMIINTFKKGKINLPSNNDHLSSKPTGFLCVTLLSKAV